MISDGGRDCSGASRLSISSLRYSTICFGGHFENLGLYELLRRRCKYIIAVSADVGPLSKRFDLGNIGNALRLARVDFGVEVELGEFKPLMHDPKTGYVKTYYAAGQLSYPCNGASEDDTGVLIFIKTGLCEDDLSLDIAEYWMDDHPAFLMTRP